MIDSTAQIAMAKTLLTHPKVAPPSGLAALGAATLAAAAAIGTIPWEVVCRLGTRVERQYSGASA